MSDSPTFGSSLTRSSGPPAPHTTDDARFAPGETLAGRYRIIALLGRGGMGEVYRADDLTLGQSVALKFLPASLARDAEWLARFRGEVRSARLVSHPNVCRVHDIGEVDGHPFLSMEYIDGEDLASLLRRIGRLPPDKALDVARQLCAGLAAAHANAVIHRDLKPANVMLDGRGNVRITDFGLAGVTGQLDRGVAGTPAYMAPELFAGAPASVQSDLYALGLVLYEVFSGRPAVQAATTIGEMRRLHSETTPAKLTSVVTDLDPLIDRVVFQCLAKDPGQRPASALAVSAALPGGDPLAAALARGETPSPEAVAAAQVAGIQPALAIACLVAIIGALAGVVALSAQTQLARVVPLEKPPVVLRQEARDAIARLGYSQPAPNVASGFLPSQYVTWIEEHDESVTRWERLRQPQPPGLTFWFRQGATPLTRDGFLLAGEVTLIDPPLTRPGTVAVVLDPVGKLRFLSAVPSQKTAPATATTFDWNLLLAEAGFDAARFTPVASTRFPPMYADARRAWDGAYPDRADVPIHVEAAAMAGQPVYFEVFEPWNELSLMERLRFVERSGVNPASILVLLFAGGAVLLARRHLRTGRGDPSGALRLAACLTVLHVAAGLLRATLVSINILMALIARGLLLGAAVWVAYMALEPFLRRHWPSTMIAWSRLLAGRLRDPLVGRDLLIGLLAGVASHLLWQVRLIAPGWLGSAPAISTDFAGLTALNGVRFTVANILSIAGSFVLVGLSFVLFFFVLALLLRKRWLAAAAVPLLLAGLVWAQAGSLAAAFTLVMYVLMTTMLLRFGLLALIVSVAGSPLLDHAPLTFDPARWYAPNSYIVLAFVAGLAVYAFRVALAGRPMFSGAFFNE